MEFSKVYVAKKSRSKEDFLRQSIIELASKIEAPMDVVNSTFGDVRETVREVIVCTAHVDTDYSASIGYDRTVEKEVYNKNSGKWETEKEKVTDWRPFSGHINGDSTSVALNSNEYTTPEEYDRIVKVIKGANVGEVYDLDAVVSSNGLECAKDYCAKFVNRGIKYPGDRHKDESVYSTTSVNQLECYKLPYYEAEYTYNGKVYKVEDYACDPIDVVAQYPVVDSSYDNRALEDTKKYTTIKKIGWIAFAVTYVLALVIYAVFKVGIALIPLLVLIATIIAIVIGDKKYMQRLNEITTGEMGIKKKELEYALQSRGYEKLTEIEEKAFYNENKISNFSKARKKKKPIVLIILSVIAILYLIIKTGL